MDDLLYKIIYCAITVLTATVVRYLVPWFNSQVDTAKLEKLRTYISDAICYAEEFVDGTKKGAEKFETVQKLAIDFAQKYGLNISSEQISSIIQGIYDQIDQAGLVNKK